MNATVRLLVNTEICHFSDVTILSLGLTFLEAKECFLDTVQAKLQVSVGPWIVSYSGDMVALLTVAPCAAPLSQSQWLHSGHQMANIES